MNNKHKGILCNCHAISSKTTLKKTIILKYVNILLKAYFKCVNMNVFIFEIENGVGTYLVLHPDMPSDLGSGCTPDRRGNSNRDHD